MEQDHIEVTNDYHGVILLSDYTDPGYSCSSHTAGRVIKAMTQNNLIKESIPNTTFLSTCFIYLSN